MSATVRYNKLMGYGSQDVRLCESCGAKRMVHVHHVEIKGMGGVSAKEDPDNPEETIGVCLFCHESAHTVGWEAVRERFRRILETRNKYLKWRKRR